MKVSINIFDCLYQIARERNITQQGWAKASGLEQPRIAELIRLWKIDKGLMQPTYTGVSCTIGKIDKLFKGLSKIIGGDTMKQKIMACADKEPNMLNKLILVAMMLDEKDDKEPIKKVFDYAKLVINADK